jgi:selenide,water dikinase
MGAILRGGAERCEAARCAVVGGHTVRDAEIKFGLAVTGTVHPDRVLTNATARPGDVLVLTKPLGTGFVTTAAKRRACPPELLDAACRNMVHLNAGGRDAMVAVGVSAATDVTGYGLAGHALEMALGSNVTLVVGLGKLPLLAGVERIDVTRHRTRGSKTNREYADPHTRFDGTPDPLRLEFFYDAQTSGGLLISVPAAKLNDLIGRLKAADAPAAAVVGEVTEYRGSHLWVKP